MNVSDFQQFLDGLAVFLESNSARGCSSEFRRMHSALRPFEHLSISQFVDFLARAEEYHRTGIVPAKSTSRKQVPVDPQKVQAALEKVRQLYENALGESVTYSMINAELGTLGKSISKSESIAVAKAFNIAGALKSKKAALAAIEGKITDRKESHERAHR